MKYTTRLLIVLLVVLCNLSANSQHVSKEVLAELERMQEELKRPFIRTSVVGNAGLIYHTELPSMKVKATLAGENLTLDHKEWKLSVIPENLTLLLESKHNGKSWKIGLGEPGQSGWKGRGDKTYYPVSGQKISNTSDGWIIKFEIEGYPASINIQILTNEIIRVGIYADQLGNQASMNIVCEADGPFYGGGERFTGCILNGKVIDNHSLDTKLDFPWPTPPVDSLEPWEYIQTYIPVPFIFSPYGLGLYTDDAFSKQLDFTDADHSSFSINSYGPSTDLYLLIGDDPKAIIEAYTFITGRPEVAPAWGYGVWMNLLEGKDVVLNEAALIREKEIPVSAIWIFDQENPMSNTGWTHWTYGYYGRDMNFVNDSLHRMGFKSMSYLRPSVTKDLTYYRMDNPAYHEGVRRKIFLDKKEVIGRRPIVDFLTEDALDMWSGFMKEAYHADHYDGYMEDFGDILHTSKKFLPPEDIYYDEQPHLTKAEYNIIYPLVYHKFANLIAEEYDPDYISFCRSGYVGSQSFSRMIWAGDQWASFNKLSGYPTTICAGITAGFAGYSNWSTDILSHSPSRELWTRWVEYGAFTPLLRDHLWEKLPTSIRVLTDEQTIDHYRKYARIHTSLFPYLYSLAHEAQETGVPIIRHTMLECPDETEGYQNEYSYFLGEDIFVAPVIEDGARTRTSYLPKGDWIYYWTGKIIEGGKKVTVDAPLEEIPVFIRKGSIIPMLPDDVQTLSVDLKGETIQDLTSELNIKFFGIPDKSKRTYELFDGSEILVSNDGKTLRVEIFNASAGRIYNVIWPDCELKKKLDINQEI